MGTRALIHIKDYTHGAKGKTLVTLYRQMDGYPDGLGSELKEKLADCSIVNGYSGDQDAPKFFNGAGCLAAYLVGVLKNDNGSDRTIGNIYIETPNASNMGEEYIYEVQVYDDGAEVWCWDVEYKDDKPKRGNLEFAVNVSPGRKVNATKLKRSKRRA